MQPAQGGAPSASSRPPPHLSFTGSLRTISPDSDSLGLLSSVPRIPRGSPGMNGEDTPPARVRTLGTSQPRTQARARRPLKSCGGRRRALPSTMEIQSGPQPGSPGRAERLNARLLDEFVSLHGPTLRASGVPERLWGRLLHKLEHEVRDGTGCGQAMRSSGEHSSAALKGSHL